MNTNTKKGEGAITPVQQSLLDAEKKGKYGTIYKSTGSLLIVCDCYKGAPKQFEGTRRGAVDSFSAGSGVRMRRYLRETDSDYRYMLTLTYPGFYPGNGAMVKEHLRRFCQELRRYVFRCGSDPERFSAFWFLEFQSRGAPHYHLFLTHQFPAAWIADTWFYIVRSDDERHRAAGTRIETIRAGKTGIMAYASKYAAKNEQKVVPEGYEKVGRFWGVYGRRVTVSAATFVKAGMGRSGAVNGPLFLFMKQVNALLFSGDIEMYKRIDGSAVFTVATEEARRKLRARICHIGAVVGSHDNMFDGAELDEGETLNGYVHDMIDLVTQESDISINDLIDLAARNRKKANGGKEEAQQNQETLF